MALDIRFAIPIECPIKESRLHRTSPEAQARYLARSEPFDAK